MSDWLMNTAAPWVGVVVLSLVGMVGALIYLLYLVIVRQSFEAQWRTQSIRFVLMAWYLAREHAREKDVTLRRAMLQVAAHERKRLREFEAWADGDEDDE